jgi:hypothetical protein
MPDLKLKEWTADELVAELRRRERFASADATRGGTRRSGAAHATRAAELQHVPTTALAQAARAHQRVIYGVDGRRDLYQVTATKVKAAARSVVALVKKEDLKLQADGSHALATQPFRDAYQLCASEPFGAQPLGCFCSGFLVAPDVVATAGHCVKSKADLAKMRFVFDFRMLGAGQARTRFEADDVYAGKALLGRELAGDGSDWALVRLDREVVGRAPVKVRSTGKVTAGQSLFVIGHPCGLPQKYAPGAKVRDNAPAKFFVANLDTYGGNSGSPVFNAGNQTVEGILVRGENDFVPNGSCYVSLVCPTTGCRGEDVTRATVWAAKVPKGAKRVGDAGRRSKR